MNDSLLLRKMFEIDRWERLIERGVFKGIDMGVLRKMCSPEVRLQLYTAIRNEEMEFFPPHMAEIPKDTPGEFRTVFVGEGADRVIQSIINDCLFELFPEMVHRSCKSYQTGLGTGVTVKELSAAITKIGRVSPSGIVGVKSDFHHYFDVVSLESIMHVFDVMEERLGFAHGTEPVINLLRKTWNCNLVFDLEGNLIEQYCGIRQGNAVGSFLADCILYELDAYMSTKYPYYVRYSDDCITIGPDPDEIVSDMNSIITKYGVSLNPKKVEVLHEDSWFKFLGYSVCGSKISFSPKAIKTFQKEIEDCTMTARSTESAIRNVMHYLYEGVKVGDKSYGWATRFLPVVNVKRDVDELNKFVMDCIRAVDSGRKEVGGLGADKTQRDCIVSRGKGRNVTANRLKWNAKHGSPEIAGYISISAMRNALTYGQGVYEALLASALM